MMMDVHQTAESSSPPELPSEHVFTLSAHTPAALEEVAANLAQYAESAAGPSLGDIAYTLQMERRRFECRRAVVAREITELVTALRDGVAARRDLVRTERAARPVVWMFPGLGVQQGGMAAGLYDTDESFRRDLDDCADRIAALLSFDIRQIVCASAAEGLMSAHVSTFVQPAVFAVEYCLARLLSRWGMRPSAVIGHSFGEYAAACVAGVLSLEGACCLVARRAQLIAALPPGAMLVVCESEERIRGLEQAGVHIAAVNAIDQCVVSGDPRTMRAFSALLESRRIEHYRLWSSRAFHSPLMGPAAAALQATASALARGVPALPMISCVTGRLASEEELADARYWARHLVEPVQFAAGLAELAQTRGCLFVEIGPGRTLTDLVRRALGHERDFECLSSLGAEGPLSTRRSLLETLGRSWTYGVDIDWQRFHEGRGRRRVPLPASSFDRRTHVLPQEHGLSPLP